MKKFTKVSVTVVAVSSALILIGPLTAFAGTATAPPLGAMSSFSILSALSMSSANITTISGDLGLSPGVASSKTGTWVHTGGSDYFGTGGLSASAQADALTAYNYLVAETPSSGVWSTDPVPDMNTPPPGIWTQTGSPSYDNTLHLNGDASSVWVFQISTDFTFAGSVVMEGTANACNVFWAVAGDATITSGTPFIGTLIASNNITSASGATVNGRLVSLNGYIHMNGANSSISGCASGTSLPSVGSSNSGTINVVKTVINDSGGTKTVADFPLFVNDSFNVGNQHLVTSGETNTFNTNGYPYIVTETSDPNYTATFSGDCDANGFLNLVPGDQKVCLITNNDKGAPVVSPVPPLIDVVKTASPLALPNGPGLVTYTYTLRNMGTVPVTDITMVGDTCSPLVRVSGDTNANNKLEVNETWVYHCTTTLFATHTNTITATGWANGISAVDIASATVIVGLPIVPPIIHVTKVPSVFTLPAPGGAVTYSYTVTNPGTAPLSDVSITDNKCTGLPGRVVGHPGDLNKNNLLDSGETWQFTCKSNLTQTTTNIGTVVGSANGLTARDFAIATVVVASPALPSTGLPPQGRTPWDIFITAGILMLVSTSLVLALKKRTV